MSTSFKSLSGGAALILSTILMAALAASGQVQTPAPKQLTDAQAQSLIKKISAAPAASRPLTAAETRKLLQYLASQTATQTSSTQVPADAATPQPVAKKDKVIRIGIVTPTADLGPGFQGDVVATPLRQTISRYLSGPVTELVPIDALVPQQIDAEAQAKKCDYVFYSAVSQKKTGGSGMGLFKGATTMASMMPGVGAVKAAGTLATAGTVGNAASAAQEAASLSKGIKAKSEVSFDYKLQAVGNPVALLSDTIKARATTDGEDLLTPLVAKIAELVTTRVTK